MFLILIDVKVLYFIAPFSFYYFVLWLFYRVVIVHHDETI